MKDKHTEALIVRWMDGDTMTEEEINQLKDIHAEEPDLILNPKEFAEIRAELRNEFPANQDVPSPELFASSLANRIKREELQEAELSILQEKVLESEDINHRSEKIIQFPWMKIIAGMAACFLLGLLLSNVFNKKSSSAMADNGVQYNSENYYPVVYSADPSLSAGFLNDSVRNVIVIDGLEAIPDNIDLFNLANVNTPIKVKPNKVYNNEITY